MMIKTKRPKVELKLLTLTNNNLTTIHKPKPKALFNESYVEIKENQWFNQNNNKT